MEINLSYIFWPSFMTLNYSKINTKTPSSLLRTHAQTLKKCNPKQTNKQKQQITNFQTTIITHIKQQLKIKKTEQILWVCGNIIMKFSRQDTISLICQAYPIRMGSQNWKPNFVFVSAGYWSSKPKIWMFLGICR